MGSRQRDRPRPDQPGRVGAGRRAVPEHRRLDNRRARGAADSYSAKAAGGGELSAGVRPAADARRGVSAGEKPGAGGTAGTGTRTRRPLAPEQRTRTVGRVGRASAAHTWARASAGRPRLGSTGPATAARRLGRVGGIAHTRAIRATAAPATFTSAAGGAPAAGAAVRSATRAAAAVRRAASATRAPIPAAASATRGVTATAADSMAAAHGSAPPARAAGLAAGQLRGTVAAPWSARKQLERQPDRRRRALVGLRQRAVTREGIASFPGHRRTAVLAGRTPGTAFQRTRRIVGGPGRRS